MSETDGADGTDGREGSRGTPREVNQPRWAPVSNCGSGGTTVGAEDGVLEESLVGQTVGSYEVVSLLGRGGIGSVYLAKHPLIGAHVAIKVLHAEFAAMPGMGERFVREARATNLVPSPHVVRIHDFGKLADGRQYAIMDYLKGLPLDQLLETHGPLNPIRVVRLLLQAASALSAAHSVGVVHRDIKPDNLFVTVEKGEELLRIVDFGIAKLTETPIAAGQTVAGMLLGTPAYCAPEQAIQGAVGPPADVYALGTVAYEMLVGAALFSEANVFEILADKVRCGNISLEGKLDVFPELHKLLESMLVKEPSQRPLMCEVEQSLIALLAAIEKGQSSQPSVVEAQGLAVADEPLVVPTTIAAPRSLRPTASSGLQVTIVKEPPLQQLHPARRRGLPRSVVAALAGVSLVALVVVALVALGGRDSADGSPVPAATDSAAAQTASNPAENPAENMDVEESIVSVVEPEPTASVTATPPSNSKKAVVLLPPPKTSGSHPAATASAKIAPAPKNNWGF